MNSIFSKKELEIKKGPNVCVSITDRNQAEIKITQEIKAEIEKLKELIDEEGFEHTIENYSDTLEKLDSEFKDMIEDYNLARDNLTKYLGV